MAGTFFYIKLILAVVLLMGLVRESLREKGMFKIPFFVFVAFIAAHGFRTLFAGEIPSDAHSQALIVIFLIFMSYETFKSKELQLDYKQILSSPVLSFTSEAIAIIKNENIEIVASNKNYKQVFERAKHLIELPTLVSRLHRGQNKVEIMDANNQRRVYLAKIRPLGAKFSILLMEDVTEKEALEHLMDEEEAYYQHLWDNAPNMIMIRTLDGEIVYMNHKMERFLGRALETVKGQNYKRIYNKRSERYKHEAEQAKLVAGEERSMQTRLKYTSEDDKIKFYEVSETLILYQNKRHIISNCIDLTIKTHTDLLLTSYAYIQDLSGENTYMPLIVVDFMNSELLFLERVKQFLDVPLEGYQMFYKGLSEGDSEKLDALLTDDGHFEPFTVVYRESHYFVVEQVIYSDSHYATGLVLKYINRKISAFTAMQIGALVLEHIVEGIVVINYDGQIEYVNDKTLKLLKFSRAELESMNIMSVTKGLTLDMVRRNWAMSKEHRTLQFERVYQTSEGEELPMEVESVLSGDSQEEKLILLLRPMKEKQMTVKSAVAPQLRYAHIFDAVEHQIVEIKLPDKTVYFYDAFEEEGGLIGLELKFLQWLNNVHDFDRSIVYENIDALMFYNKRHLTFEYRYFLSGEWHWIRSTGKYIESPQSASIVLVNQNITEVKTMENRLEESRHLLIESERISEVAHWKYEVSKNEFVISDTFLEVVGVVSGGNRIHYEQLVESILWTDRSFFEDQFYKFIWQGEALDVIVRIQPTGAASYLSFAGKVYTDEDGAPLYAIGTVKNITLDVQRHKKLQQEKMFYEEMIESLPFAVALVIRGGSVKVRNEKFDALFSTSAVDKLEFREIKQKILTRYYLGEENENDTIELASTEQYYTLNGKSGERLVLISSPVLDSEGRYYGNLVTLYSS